MRHPAPLSPALRGLLVAKAAVVGGLVAYGSQAPALDVVVWTGLCGLAAATLLSFVGSVSRQEAPRPSTPPVVVLPERSVAGSAVPDAAVQARQEIVEQARLALLHARRHDAELDELLALTDALHEAELDLARATLTAGGWVAPALRDELALRDRAAQGVEPSDLRGVEPSDR